MRVSSFRSFQPRPTAELTVTILLPHVLLHTALPLHLRESDDMLSRAAEIDGMLSKLFECSGCAPSRLRACPVGVSAHHVLLKHILRLTHHSHPAELSGTPHRFRILAIRSVQDDQSHLRAEGCCLKGIQRLQGTASASASCIRSQSSCLSSATRRAL